jgi:hypothetical protein
MKLKKGAHKFTFESDIRTRGGALCCAIFKRQETQLPESFNVASVVLVSSNLESPKKEVRRFTRSSASKPMNTWDILVKT